MKRSADIFSQLNYILITTSDEYTIEFPQLLLYNEWNE